MNTTMKKLYRSRTSRYLAGVCGGIGEYFNIDPNIVRIIAVLLGFGSIGTLLIVYLAAALLLPEA